MRSRSRRLFVVLLHLVGVSTNLPHRTGDHRRQQIPGIVGVNPSPIVLERLDLHAYQDGLDGVLREEEKKQKEYWKQKRKKRKRIQPDDDKEEEEEEEGSSTRGQREDAKDNEEHDDQYQEENMLLAEPYWFQVRLSLAV